MSAADVAMVSKQGPNVNCVIDYSPHGCPSLFDESLKPSHRCRNELAIEIDSLVHGHRTIILDVLRRQILEKKIRSVHIRISRINA